MSGDILREYLRLVLSEASNQPRSWRYFHISLKDLGDDFVFTPRVPKDVYRDINQDEIEDTETPRVSWAPSIRSAREALGHHIRNGYIYAVHDIPDIEHPQHSSHGTTCPAGPQDTNDYGPGFTWQTYADFEEENTGERPLGVERKDAVTDCVPDAGDTGEVWSLSPITGTKIGVLKNGQIVAESLAGSRPDEAYEKSTPKNLMLNEPGTLVEPDVRKSIAAYLTAMGLMHSDKGVKPKGPTRKTHKV